MIFLINLNCVVEEILLNFRQPSLNFIPVGKIGKNSVN